jgi:hypothetical protein
MTVITVTNNSSTGIGSLRNAVDIAQSGDTIKFDSSLSNRTITLNNFIGIQKSLVIDGVDAPGLTISGGNKTNLFRLAKENKSLTVRNLTLADSYYQAAPGGAIWATDDSTINIENTKFINNVSLGAALHGQAGTVMNVTNSSFDNNNGAKISNKPYSTGAISLFAYGSLNVKNSNFTNNKGFGGGAIRVTSGDLTVENSLFTGNDSTLGANKSVVPIPGGGGAIYLDAASVPNDPKYYKGLNQRETEGGKFIVRNSRFEQNRAAGQGGAIMAWGYNQDRIVIEDSEIIDNEVIKNVEGMAQGGGLWLMGFVEMKNNTISNNQSADLGGGAYIWGELPASITKSRFSGNQAFRGGAIYDGLWASKLEINSTNFDSNFASNQGDEFYSKNNVPLTLRNSQFGKDTPDKPLNGSPKNPSDIISGSNNGDKILGTKQNNHLFGLQGNDLLDGLEGDDSLDGGKSFDTLMGGGGKDTLVGGDGINNLNGGNGDDFLVGGNGQDLMQGGSGQDTYVIGDKSNRFYDSYAWYDRALIKDFQAQQDLIQLKGKASDYSLRSLSGSGVSSTGIFYNNELVVLVEGFSATNFSLTANYITYK